MKYKIRVIHLSDKIKEAKLEQIHTRISTGFELDHGPHFDHLCTNSIAWLAVAIELLETEGLAWVATNG